MRKFSGDTLLVATHNAGKLEEIVTLLEPYGIKVVGAAAMQLGEPEETETTFVGNARIKAHAAAQATGLPSLSDDSGIEIDALGGAPGVYTADWAETETGRDFVMAMAKAHDRILEVGVAQPWTARFCCTLVLHGPMGMTKFFPAPLTGKLFGRCAERTATATTQFFNRTDTTLPSVRWTGRRRTRSVIAPMRLPNL